MMESITGKIENLKEIPAKNLYILEIGGESFSNFGPLPSKIKKLFESNVEVILDYKINGKWKNIITVDELPSKDLTTQIPIQDTSDDGAEDLSPYHAEYDLVETGGFILQACYEEITRILKHKPEDQGDKAMCNSLFIWVTRERNMRK